jgi:iron complex outermembrane receptor protein
MPLSKMTKAKCKAWVCRLRSFGLRRFLRSPLLAGIATLLFNTAIGLAGQSLEETDRVRELRNIKLEELLRGEVTSVSRRSEELFETPAAAFIITSDDIRRSGSTTIADALRMAPGISSAHIDANKWAVASRGFNDRFTDKLLVLIDGRSVYSPSTSGVFWDVQNYPLEDIDRIEVIRGSGGTLWGANAVNGVINIITKSADDTRGGYVKGGYGTEERGFGEFRYGDRISENGFLRGYVKYFNRDNFQGGKDDWNMAQTGFRADWKQHVSELTLQGDLYYGNLRQQQVVPIFTAPYTKLVNEEFHASGGNVLARYKRQFSEDSDLQLQTYYDRTERTEMVFDGYRDTFDVDFQHRFSLPLRQNVMYGLGYRYLPDHFRNPDTNFVYWNPADRNQQLFSGFVQDEISIIENRLRLTLGTKVEHNDFTGWEVQPNARLAWLISTNQTAWGAISRAVQTPQRNANDISTLLPVPPQFTPGPNSLPVFVVGNGSRSLKAQDLLSYEIGYRIQPVRAVSFDVSLFYNDYERFITGVPGKPYFVSSPTPHLVVPVTAVNGGSGHSYGAEVAAEWHATDWWRLVATYSYLRLDLNNSSTSVFAEGKDPQHQASLRSSIDLPGGLEFDLWGRYTDRLPSFGIAGSLDMDARLAWKVSSKVEIAVVGQNLLHENRYQFGSAQFTQTIATPVPRGVYGQLTIRF